MQDKKNSPKPRPSLPENGLGYRVAIGSDGLGVVDAAAPRTAARPHVAKPAKPPIPNTFSYWAYRSA